MNETNFPRNALVWLLVSTLFVYLPLQMQLPIWTFAVFAAVVIWRWMMHLGRWPYPTKIVKVIVVVLGIGAVLISAQGKFHLESATSFILVAALLKVLEIKTQRDGYIVIFLSFFLLAVNFIYDQGILLALYCLFVVWVLISALVGLHQSSFSDQATKSRIHSAGKTSFQVLLMSLPMMLVLFVLFPRMGPLWSLNLQSDKAKTGLSEQMSPGDIAELSNSDELVFRVQFKNNDSDLLSSPSPEQWYWRALVLDQHKIINGQSQWSVSRTRPDIDWFPQSWQPEKQAGVYDYTIIQEPTQKNWLIGLRGVAAMENGIGMTNKDLIVSRKKLYQRKEYSVRSWPEMDIAGQGITQETRNQNLQLDSFAGDSNPRSRSLAQSIYLTYASDQERITAAMKYYQQQSFSYTLKPQRMESNDIDDFLFNKQSGFCAHYSSSLVFLLRTMGIPARVVAGYQGGEVNSSTGHITVRQYDAHAWVEAWIEGIGWRSFDPTAQVAPDRISLGLRDALADQSEFLSNNNVSLAKFSHLPFLNDIRMQLDQLNYYWHKTVLSFNKNKQGSVLKEWFGGDFLKKSLYWLVGLFCTIFFSITLILLWNRPERKMTIIEKSLLLLDKKMAKFALQRDKNEGLEDYSQRLQQQFPTEADNIRRLLKQLQAHYYGKNAGSDLKGKKGKLERKEKELSFQINSLSKRLKVKG